MSSEQEAVSNGLGAARVREALAAAGIASVRQIAARLDVPDADYRSRDRVRWILRDLVAHGQARAERAHGEIWFALTEKAGGRGAKQLMLWRAMRASPHGFTISEMAVLAGTDRDYAKRYVGWLRLEDWLEARGPRALEGGIKAQVYRIVPGKEGGPAPQWNRRGEVRRRAGTPAPRTGGCVDAGQETVKGILVEMEDTLGVIAGGLEFAKVLLSEMRVDLGIITPTPALPPQGGGGEKDGGQ